MIGEQEVFIEGKNFIGQIFTVKMIEENTEKGKYMDGVMRELKMRTWHPIFKYEWKEVEGTNVTVC